jgi:hypothetical protein
LQFAFDSSWFEIAFVVEYLEDFFPKAIPFVKLLAKIGGILQVD